MPRIFDNINHLLAPALQHTLRDAHRADFCVGYFNLRGWQGIDTIVDEWPGGEGHCVRLLVGMQRPADEQLREYLSLGAEGGMDLATAQRVRTQMAARFREQLTWGAPNNRDEASLQRLARQLRARKVIVKLFLRYPLHAKLYLAFREDFNNPTTGYLGSSNLTFSGLQHQGELNIDVLDHSACNQLTGWFEARWNDRFSIDISEELAEIIEQSWAREELLPPYYVYLKMVYHLAQEARAGLSEFQVPRDMAESLLPFQSAAVRIAARHLHRRGGVLLGDVVGLGKTFMATALARIFKDDFGMRVLVICPRNLVSMWEQYNYDYDLGARVLSITRAQNELREARRYHLVVIDESHNLRNPEGKRYAAIRDYIASNDSRVILLSATPYNKSYLDLSAQLRLFIQPDQELGIRPEQLIRDLGQREFTAVHQSAPDTLLAFEKSPYADDWRELMRLFMVRRTRGFIKENYARVDPVTGQRFLEFSDGRRSYFPARQPRTIRFGMDGRERRDQYARLYDEPVVERINTLCLPRYGLGQYINTRAAAAAPAREQALLEGLGRAGKRLIGFSRTNLFKRLESSGEAFMLSLHRHLLRNYIFLHALEENLELPIGTQNADMLDTSLTDEDSDALATTPLMEYAEDEEGDEVSPEEEEAHPPFSEAAYRAEAATIYALYRSRYARRFRWAPVRLFRKKRLREDLERDCRILLEICRQEGEWDAGADRKLHELHSLLAEQHAGRKVLVFSQFADTVRYLERELKALGVEQLEGVTGQSADPTALARRFSPRSNGAEIAPDEELRVLITTDVLSEGQNLQDCSIVVNYDLPWAIIRLIQRAGRVDRIGQQAETILVYSFLPAEGVEKIIRLRARVQERLQESGEVLGSDETFFDGEGAMSARELQELYTENANLLEGDDDTEVDLASYAYQVWKNAIEADSSLEQRIEALPDVVFSTRHIEPLPGFPEGVLVFLKSSSGVDSLAWIDRHGQPFSQSQAAILRAAACAPHTPAHPHHPRHHELVRQGVEYLLDQEAEMTGGQLGRPAGARYRVYHRLKDYLDELRGTLFSTTEEYQQLTRAADEIFRYPLQQGATDTLNRQLRSGISNEMLAELIRTLRNEERLCRISGEQARREARIICSMGLFDMEPANPSGRGNALWMPWAPVPATRRPPRAAPPTPSS